ncbi:MAG: outer membrane protein assembly factor BamD [Bacteroidetes bacterium]|nr:outer membrane protein assembly factor BamD [Bacteroidota bacterium]
MKKHILLIGILVVTLFSCGKYEKILKSSDYKMKYQKAFEYYNAEEYVRAATIFEQIVPVFKGTDKSDTVSYYHAMSYYKQKDYTLAGHYLKNFFQNYPYSPFADEAQFLSAYCFYMDSPRPSLDQETPTLPLMHLLCIFEITPQVSILRMRRSISAICRTSW